MFEENYTIKTEPVYFENSSKSFTSINIKEELNEINNVQNDNSDCNNSLELSKPKIEPCENSFEDSEIEDPENYIGLCEPKLENCDNSLQDFELEDPLSLNSVEKHSLCINLTSKKPSQSIIIHPFPVYYSNEDKQSLKVQSKEVQDINGAKKRKPGYKSIIVESTEISKIIENNKIHLEENNRLRARLGLPPLNANSSTAGKPNLSTYYEQTIHTGRNKNQLAKTKDFEKQKLFKCGQCEFYSIEKFNVDKHVKTAHKKPFKCSKCDFMNSEKADVLKHIQMTHKPDNSKIIENNEIEENNRIRALLGLPPLNSNDSLATEKQNLRKDYEVTVHEGKKLKQEDFSTDSLKTVIKTKKCSYCWIEVANRGHFNHEEACFRKFAKKVNKKSRNS